MPQPTEWQRIRNQIKAASIFTRANLISVHSVAAICERMSATEDRMSGLGYGLKPPVLYGEDGVVCGVAISGL